MERTVPIRKTAAAAVVLAAVSTVAVVGCRFTDASGSAGAGGATTKAEVGVSAIALHTQTAERHVQQALPHADATGQVQLGEASVEHQAVLLNAGQVEQSLVAANTELEQVHTAMEQERSARTKLENQWYVTWGRRVETLFWTLAATWLIGNLVALVLGLGSPIAWLGSLRNVLTSVRQRWFGNALATAA